MAAPRHEQGRRKAVVSGLEILAGAVPPVDVHLNVTLNSGGTGARMLAPQLAAALDQHRPRIEAWLESRPENGALLLSDPLAALDKIGVTLAPDLVASVRRMRRQAAVGDVLPAGVTLKQLSVTLRDPPRGNTDTRADTEPSGKTRKR
jgi:hypothetical protein